MGRGLAVGCGQTTSAAALATAAAGPAAWSAQAPWEHSKDAGHAGVVDVHVVPWSMADQRDAKRICATAETVWCTVCLPWVIGFEGCGRGAMCAGQRNRPGVLSPTGASSLPWFNEEVQ